jgi:F-type H+-transporting ATPase subunit b
MITIDTTMVIQIINILILIVVMNAVLYKPVRTILAKRKEKLAELSNEIDTFKKNTELRQEEINRKLGDARNRAKAELEKAKSAAQATSAETLAAVRQDTTANKNTQLEEIEKQFADAQQQLKGQIDNFASDMATKILGRAV